MITEVEIKGKKRLVYMVKRGTVNDVVIIADTLDYVDANRLNDMSNKGGELMKTMRDTTLDNGKNALKTYKDLLIVVPHPEPVGEKVAASGEDEAPKTKTPTKKKKKRSTKKKKKKTTNPES